MKIKVVFEDGIVGDVLVDEEAKKSGIKVEIVNFDKDIGNRELLRREYSEPGLVSAAYDISHCEPITKEDVSDAYRKGIITLIDSPNGDGAACCVWMPKGEQDIWFYFGGTTAEEMSAEEYRKCVPEEDIVNEIFSVLEDWLNEGEEFLESYEKIQAAICM